VFSFTRFFWVSPNMLEASAVGLTKNQADMPEDLADERGRPVSSADDEDTALKTSFLTTKERFCGENDRKRSASGSPHVYRRVLLKEKVGG